MRLDPIEKARETVEKLGITYRVAYGLDAEVVSRISGAYYEKERKLLQPAGFLIRPNNTIEIACYSSGPIGRFVAKDVLRVVQFHKSHKEGKQ